MVRRPVPIYFEKKPHSLLLNSGNRPFSLLENVTRIQLEILNNGPVEAAFDVYSDFIYYEKGIYKVKIFIQS